MFSIEPGACGALRGSLGNQRIQITALCGTQAVSILEQRPAQPLEIGIGALLLPTDPVERSGGLGDHVELVEGDAGFGQVLGDASNISRRHVDAYRLDLLG